MSGTRPPEPPDSSGPPESSEFGEFFHTEDLPGPRSRPVSHRAPTPLIDRVLAPITAVVVVIVVIVLLIVINGHNPGHGNSPAAVSIGGNPRPVASSLTGSGPAGSVSPGPSKSPGGTSSAASRPVKTPVAPAAKPSHHAAPVASSAPVHKPTVIHAAKPATAMAPVSVLNNSRRTGLAHAVASDVQSHGWTIAAVGNLSSEVIAQTTLYYAPGDHAAAVHLAHEFSSIGRLEPEASAGFHGTGLTLVLTEDWAG